MALPFDRIDGGRDRMAHFPSFLRIPIEIPVEQHAAGVPSMWMEVLLGVQLLAIKFNHDPTGSTHEALNLRRNATEFVNVPEWERGVSVNPEDSPAAYAVRQVRGHVVTIQAKFRRRGTLPQPLEIRALDATIDRPGAGGCVSFVRRVLRSLFRSLFGGVLGEAAARTVAFGVSGESAFESFDLRYTRLDWMPVGVHTVTWRWQYRTSPGDRWVDFDLTRHRVYVLVDTPADPWQQAPYTPTNTQLPWSEVLDHACDWAWGAHDETEAACGVTRGVFALGPVVVTYDCPGGGGTHYALGGFNCTAFVERLRGGPGNGYYVNCTDCATFVATFANTLGCDLWQSRMGYGFGLNPLLAIGSGTWQPACGWSGFSYHEVAWTGACDVNDHVFDACLEVDADADPTSLPHTPLLPCDMRFGNAGDGDYRDRLATPAGSPACDVQPSTRQRRIIF